MTKPSLTAAVLIIGNEILSGATPDANVPYLGRKLASRGIRLTEVRIVADIESNIITALNALRATYTYVFTTGGIGPTHDDITADCIAKAFNTPLEIHPHTKNRMKELYAGRGQELNQARLLMARLPVGAEPIECAASFAPGFRIENVYVMAGIPRVMQSMFEAIEGTLKTGAPVLSRTIECNQRESDIAFPLGDIQRQFPTVDIGSYPHMGQTPSLSLVLRSTDIGQLNLAADAVVMMLREKGETVALDVVGVS